MKLLIIIDMQNDFIDGALGTKEAVAIVPKVAEKIKKARLAGKTVVFTRDTHQNNYLETQEGKIFQLCTVLKELKAGKFLVNWKWAKVSFLIKLRLGLCRLPIIVRV